MEARVVAEAEGITPAIVTAATAAETTVIAIVNVIGITGIAVSIVTETAIGNAIGIETGTTVNEIIDLSPPDAMPIRAEATIEEAECDLENIKNTEQFCAPTVFKEKSLIY